MMIPLDYKIFTEKYILRFPNETDIDFVFSATQFEGFNDGMLWDPPKNKNELLIPISNNKKSWNKGEAYVFTIINRQIEDERFGRISIRSTNEVNNWNIGFWTHPKFQNNGVMSDVVFLILKFGFELLNAEIIIARYAIWNIASERVLQKNGFQFVRKIEKAFYKNGEWQDENEVEISKSKFKRISNGSN